MPTEAQWEYACRAGSRTAFSFGDTISTDEANYDSRYIYAGGKKGKFWNKPTPVGLFPPNAWGLRDMHGNVSEWCQDVYDSARRRSLMIDPAGGRFSSNYDAANQLIQMLNPQGKLTSLSYDPRGLQKVQVHGNTSRTTQLYDAASQLLVVRLVRRKLRMMFM